MAWCDVELAGDGGRIPMATSHDVVIDGRAFTVDLCEDHEAALWKPFVAMVEAGSAPAPKTAQNRAQRAVATAGAGGTRTKTGRPVEHPERVLPVGVRCPLPDCGIDYAGRTEGALSQHLRTAHDTTGVSALGSTCAVCGEVREDMRSLAQHLGREHPDMAPPSMTGALAAWWWASGHGDPHGVIEASGLLAFQPPLAEGATRVQVSTP